MGKDTPISYFLPSLVTCFNPCFNGWMGKDKYFQAQLPNFLYGFNPCFNGWMGKDIDVKSLNRRAQLFQSLF